MESAVCRKADCDADNSALACQGVVSGPGLAEFFTDTSLIYGLERTAFVLTSADPNLPLGGLSITYYIDNNCAKCALIRGGSRIAAIAVLARISWAICAIRRITPWLGRSPADETFRISQPGWMNYSIVSNQPRIFHWVQLLQIPRIGLAQQPLNGFFGAYELAGTPYPNIYGSHATPDRPPGPGSP